MHSSNDIISYTIDHAGYSSGICSLSVDPLTSEILFTLPDIDLETYVSRLAKIVHASILIVIVLFIQSKLDTNIWKSVQPGPVRLVWLAR